MLKLFGYTAFSLTLTLIAGDLLGVAACFLGDLLSGNWSIGAVYAVWFVLGVFGGMFHYLVTVGLCNSEAVTGAPDPKNPLPKEPLSRALPVIGLTLVLLLLLSYACERIWWIHGVDSSDGYVPDSKSATMVFFITMAASMFFTLWVSRLDATPLRPK